jgi:RNA polymerase sigma-70 factor (ECF subfamily)
MLESDPVTLAYAAGRAAFPEVVLDLAEFNQVVAGLDPAHLAANGADVYLAVAGARGDERAIRQLDDLLRAVAGAVRRFDRSEAFVGEILQRVRIHLLVRDGATPPRLTRYDGRASLRVWLGVCATRMALHVLRGDRHAKEIATDWSDELAALPTGQSELETVRARYADIFSGAWREACAELPARQKAVLKMCFVEGRSLESVAAAYAVHRVTVWRWLEDAKRRLLDGTRVRLLERLELDAPGTHSLIELVQSQIDLGLSVLDAS